MAFLKNWVKKNDQKSAIVVGHTSKSTKANLSWAGSFKLSSNADTVLLVHRQNNELFLKGQKSKTGTQNFSQRLKYDHSSKKLEPMENIQHSLETQISAINLSQKFKNLSLKCTQPRKHRKTMKKIGRPLSTLKRFIKCKICPKHIKPYDRFKERQHIQRPCHQKALKAKQDR